MSSQASKQLKPSKPPNLSTTSASSPSSTSRSPSSISSHFAIIELKQRILNSLSKLSDRDTQQIAVEELEKIIQTLSPDGVSMLLNCLYDVSNDPKSAVKREALRLLAFLCTSHTESASTHLTKIIAHIVKRLKDSDSAVRDSCRDAIGVLSSQYLRGDGDSGNLGPVVSLFVKPLFEAMGEQNKTLQAGSAMCMARMVECAGDPPIGAFQKLCPRICKYLNSQNFLAKAALLPVVASISQVGAIAPQSLPVMLQSINECLESADWATRKAAADTLTALASHSSQLVADGTTSTIALLEACRFDKVKPVRDSMTEALQLWKKIAGKGGDGIQDELKARSHDGKSSELVELADKPNLKKTNPGERMVEPSSRETSNCSSPSFDSLSKVKGSISDKTVGILKKKAPALTDKELNLEFFQKLEARGSGDLPVEVVVPRKCPNSSNSQDEEESDPNDKDSRGRSNHYGNIDSDDIHGSGSVKFQNMGRGTVGMSAKQQNFDDAAQDKWTEQRVMRGKDLKARGCNADDSTDISQKDNSSAHLTSPGTDDHSEGPFINNKGNWLAIQRQLTQLERQQTHLMDMLQDFMGGSHDSMITLENRVRGLERIVEDMAQDLTVSSGRKGSTFMVGYDGSSARLVGKYNGLSDYSSSKLGRGGNGWIPFAERSLSSDCGVSGVRGRDPPWRSDVFDAWDSCAYVSSGNGHISSRRALGGDDRSSREEHDSDQVGNTRAWNKGQGSVRLGEGPSARSVWQASKDEATLEAIRVAGEDNETSRAAARVAIPELTAEALGNEIMEQDRDPIWASWSNVMDALNVGDIDSAYAEVLSTGDDLLLVKLMGRSGPVLDQVSNETASEVLHAVGQFLLEQNLFDIGLSWVQQLVDLVIDNGADSLGIPMEVKRVLLQSLHEASSAIDSSEDWEGSTPDRLMLQLASAWGIDLLQLDK